MDAGEHVLARWWFVALTAVLWLIILGYLLVVTVVRPLRTPVSALDVTGGGGDGLDQTLFNTLREEQRARAQYQATDLGFTAVFGGGPSDGGSGP